MKPLSANKAAKLAKKTKQTILDAINDNSLSATKNERGHWQIDPAELNRVFPYEIEDRKEDQSQKPEKTTQETIETSALGVELKFLRERLTEKDETIRKMEAERENERELLERNLDDLRTAMARITDQRDGQGRGWWPFGRKKAKTA